MNRLVRPVLLIAIGVAIGVGAMLSNERLLAQQQSSQNDITVSPLTVESIGPEHGRLHFTTSDGTILIADFRSIQMSPAPRGLLVKLNDATITRPTRSDPATRDPVAVGEFRFLLAVDGDKMKVLPAE